MDFENIDFDDIISDSEKNQKKKKKVKNSKDKGNRFERSLGSVLKERFGFEFTRTMGSGNRWGQVVFLPKHAQQTFSGDLVCPENFTYVIECKGGYNDIDLCSCFEGGLAQIDEWIEQASDEGSRCGRKPIIVWKKNYKPWLVFIKKVDLVGDYKYLMFYRDWCIILLGDFLLLPDNHFFESKNETKENQG